MLGVRFCAVVRCLWDAYGKCVLTVETVPEQYVAERVQLKKPPPSQLRGLKPWRPGQSGNPAGRPRAVLAVRDLAREHTTEAVEKLVHLMRHAESEQVQHAAAESLLSRGWGKPVQSLDVMHSAPREIVVISGAGQAMPLNGSSSSSPLIEHDPDE